MSEIDNYMVSAKKVIGMINGFSLSERLMIIEEVLKNIREEKSTTNSNDISIKKFVGIIDEKEATLFEEAISESRKVDENEW
ncbi:MAG: hypothetical protein AAFR66_23225 [Bacteroidota bacterium]